MQRNKVSNDLFFAEMHNSNINSWLLFKVTLHNETHQKTEFGVCADLSLLSGQLQSSSR